MSFPLVWNVLIVWDHNAQQEQNTASMPQTQEIADT